MSAKGNRREAKERELQGSQCYDHAREIILHLWDSPDPRAQRLLAVGKSAPKCILILARQVVAKTCSPSPCEWRDYEAGIRSREASDREYRRAKRARAASGSV